MSGQAAFRFGEEAADYFMCTNPNPRQCLNAKHREPIPKVRALTYSTQAGYYCRGCGRRLVEYADDDR